MKERSPEEEIRAQLRDLTARTRRLREDLNDLIRPHARSSRADLIRRAEWPKPVSGSPDSDE